MASTSRSGTDELAARVRQSQEKLSEMVSGEGASQQVMSGFAEAYRAWLEALSAKPQTMMDLQSSYMQEQMKLWMGSLQPAAGSAEPAAAGAQSMDKRFSAPEWDSLPVFRYFRDSYLLTSRMMMKAVDEANLDAPTKQRMRFFMRQYLSLIHI